MLRIGIIGAENSHCTNIATLCNVSKKVPGARVTHVWGEKPAFARDAAAKAQIPTIVKDWRDLLGQVDGVMIDHRHPLPHYETTRFYLQHGVPCFTDKPFTYRTAHAQALLKLAQQKKTALTSFSVIPMQKNFADFKRACRNLGTLTHLTTAGPVDLKSKWGGIFFYGIHQVDAVIELLGADVERVLVQRHGAHGVASMHYRNGPSVTLNLIRDYAQGFHWQAMGTAGQLAWKHVSDELPYLRGAQTFVKMFKTGVEPFDPQRLLAPVRVLEAMEKSLRLGKPVRLGKP